MSADWQHGFCGCFDNLGICLISYIVPCYQFGKNAESVGDSCLLCGLGFLIPGVDIFLGAHIRSKIREAKGIQGSFIGDLVLWCCCPLCALIQEGQEVQALIKRQRYRPQKTIVTNYGTPDELKKSNIDP